MIQKMVSIIIPNYNCEDYLGRCVLSAINQTYKELEIIVVDDGSTDSSRNIIEELKNKDSRIKTIYKENGGLSSARNAALDVAEGEYIAFLDSDDYIRHEYIEHLYKAIIKNKSDLSCCFYNSELKNLEEINFNKEQGIINYFTEKYFLESACYKLYRKDIFNNLRFKLNVVHEDTFITYKIIEKCERITYVNYDGYIVEERSDSITRSSQGNKHYDRVIAGREIYEHYKNTKFEELAYKKYIGILLYYILKTDRSLENNNKAYIELKGQINRNGFKGLKPQFVPFVVLLKFGLLNKIKLS